MKAVRDATELALYGAAAVVLLAVVMVMNAAFAVAYAMTFAFLVVATAVM